MSETVTKGAETLDLVIHGREEKVVAHACGDCGTVYGLNVRDLADQCCRPYHCHSCGSETERYWTKCCDCRRRERREQEEERFRAAERIAWDEGAGAMLYDEEHDRWIIDEEDATEGDPPTRYAYATTPRRLRIDAETIVENACEDGEHHEGAYDQIHRDDFGRLQSLLDEWCEGTGVVSHFPDHARVVVFEEPDHA